MGSGGHNIKPAAQKKAEGTSRKDRDENRLELAAPVLSSIPAPPDYFDKDHVKKWNEVCKKLHTLGILTEADTDAIECYVKNWVISKVAWADVCENGQTIWVEQSNGNEKPITNPSLIQFNEAEGNMKRLYAEFGFTPRARMSIKVQREKPKAESAILKAMARTKSKTA